MTKHLDPRTLLKQIAIPLLRRFFEQRGELLDVPWDALKENRLTNLIYSAWQQLPETRRRQIQGSLHEIVEAANEHGPRVFAEELQAVAPERAWEFKACCSRLNKALWFYLNFPQLFDQAMLFARADSLSAGRYAVRRNSLPRTPITVTPDMTTSLASALRDYYWPNQMRGNHCHVEHYTRTGGNEYFFAYLDDWPDSRMVFWESGELDSFSARFAFSVLFVFCPHDGSLELIANGGHAIQYPLQRAFCRSILGMDVEPADPMRPAYRLQQVLDPSFAYPTATTDCVGRIRLSRIRLTPTLTSYPVTSYELKFAPTVTRPQWLEVIQNHLAGHGLRPTQVLVEQASFQLTFLRTGFGRSRSLTFTVAMPSNCDLKSKPDEVRDVGQRCLRMWGMLDA